MALYSYIHTKYNPKKQQNEDHINRILIRALATVFSLFIFLLTSLLLNHINDQQLSPIITRTLPSKSIKSLDYAQDKQSNNDTVLGETIQSFDSTQDKQSNNITISPSPTISISINTSPTISNLPIQNSENVQQIPSKKLYTVAIIGDSMVDTMGEVLEYLDAELTKKYPGNEFLLFNYGTGAQNVEAGLARFNSHFKYQSRDYPSLPELKPDILIVGSFAYNPFTPHDRDKHWLTLTKLVQTAKQYTPRVYMLAEIAPLREDFGKGPNGVNWSDDANYEHSLRIIQQLENVIGLSKTLNVPLIDTFTPSFHSEDRIGNKDYVNPSDGIHPSIKGHQFMAKIISEAIKLP